MQYAWLRTRCRQVTVGPVSVAEINYSRAAWPDFKFNTIQIKTDGYFPTAWYRMITNFA